MVKQNKRRQALLQIAYQMFTTQGYDQTSVDDIITAAKIAKGTFYYYFASKEQILEAVIAMVIDNGVARAQQVVHADMDVAQKLVATILALRVAPAEQSMQAALHTPANIVLHQKINEKIINVATPLIAQIVREAQQQGIFHCDDNITERVKMTLILSNAMFDHGDVTPAKVTVFIDTLEKIFGAKSGTLAFIAQLIKE